ncbi:MAG: hypothetical protein CL910_04915, partial [Deltaproteobacteria bacterium]|nr:hypothetical protein [Deltaproteobacteria bacterium]
METGIEVALGRGLARWTRRASARPGLVLVLAVVLGLLALGYSVGHLGVNSETDDVFDAELPFRQLRTQLDEALPARNDNLLVVIDGPTAIAAGDAAAELTRALAAEPERFASAFVPGAGPFFERNGLLYLELAELEALADDLAAAQPFLAEIARDPSLRGLLAQLTRAVDEAALDRGDFDFDRVLEGITQAIADAERREFRPEAFGELVLGGEDEGEPVRRYVIVEPRPDYSGFVPGRASLGRLHELIAERGWNDGGAIRARVTGDLALKTEELGLVKAQAAAAGVASFILVGLILWTAQRSARLIAATLLSLVLGLVWTAGFAALTIGHLNIISVAFAVLFIGLGVDFGIHLTLRYRELRSEAADHEDALRRAIQGVGGSLVLCAVTTAVGFYSFVPTDFLGVAELGVISGSGMLISLAGTLTVLPACLALGGGPRIRKLRLGRLRIPGWPTRVPRTVCAAAALLSVGALFLVPELHFDANPLRVRDPQAASVQTFYELLEGGDINPWSIEVLERDLEAADDLARRLEELPSVARTSTLSSYVPTDQEAKLAILEDVALFLGFEDLGAVGAPTLAQEEAALLRFRGALRGLEEGEGETRREVARDLGAALDGFLVGLDGAGVEILRVSLVQSVLDRIERLQTALSSEGVRQADLPAVLSRRMIAEDGRALVEVYPERSLNDDEAVAVFVREVRSLTEGATGPSVYMFEASRAIMAALRQALTTAVILIVALLLILWRNPRDMLLVLAPLTLAGLLTAAAAVLLGLPINFADVIVVPLLLGIGVDSGIHLVHRFRSGALAEGILDTSTSRA